MPTEEFEDVTEVSGQPTNEPQDGLEPEKNSIWYALSGHAKYRYKTRMRKKGISLDDLDKDISSASVLAMNKQKSLLQGMLAKYVVAMDDGTIISILPIRNQPKSKQMPFKKSSPKRPYDE